MSTYWGYACISHDPHLVSEHWFNHGEETLTDAFLKERAGEWPDREVIVGINDALGPEPAEVWHRSYGTTAPIEWLREHPRCEVVLHNEYRETKQIGATVAGSVVTPPRELTA